MTFKRLRSELGWAYHWECGGKVYLGRYGTEMCDHCEAYGMNSWDICWNDKNVRFLKIAGVEA